MPCVVRVAGGTVGSGSSATANTQVLYSVSTGTSTEVTVNLTPLTSLVLARAHGGSLDDAWLEGLDLAGRQRLLSGLDAAISALAPALAGGAFIEAASSSLEDQLATFASSGELPPAPQGGSGTDPQPNTGDFPDTTGASGVRLATRGTVGGDAQNDTVRDWGGAGEVDVGSVSASSRKAIW